ncbi:Uncharacterised protein [[Pasteurella] mairii]|uniref:Uncharacterized protein n=1 Tax=[Pasteurella] mairii TaxID=757 RepID=A0A379B332_9PAST|nr:Uncharacterised protein [[Pasteurella] mairii]
MALPRSTFYYSPKEVAHQTMRAKVLALHQTNGGRDGYRIIRSCVKVKRRKKYGKTSHIAPNLLERDFKNLNKNV